MANEPWPRFELVTKVQHGELTPDEAELEAARLKLPPFEVAPDPSNFDPMSETTWSLIMALAWIMWRTPDAVREMWDLYRQKFRFWEFCRWQEPGGAVHEGHFLKRKLPAGLSDLAVLYVQDPSRKRVIAHHPEAFRLLSVEAERGAWMASGLPTDGGPRREIAPFEWGDLLVCEAPAPPSGSTRSTANLYSPTTGSHALHNLAVVRDKKRGALQFGYDDVRIPVAGLLQSFPPRETNTGRTPAETPTQRGDFSKVQSAVNALYPSGIPEPLDTADIIKRIADYLRENGARVPNSKTMHKHIIKMRGERAS